MSVDTEHPLQHEAEREASKKRPHVFGYLAALFAVALLLLGMAYLMQQRESEAAVNQSISAMQSVEALREENEALKGEVSRLEAENEALQESLQETEDKLASAYKSCAALQGERMYDREVIFALDLLRLLEQAYGSGDYKNARTFAAALETLSSYLYSDTIHDYEGKYDISSADRYRAIADALD